ncbi:TPR-like protein [Thamnocephalis sphaerospora]|uniref:ER membrane protein complex subunit 2 n=1 Tax=Thamnocephalis sphaerospora TaxID=78915 RepID=A0A4P9XMG5_9FUNG|nr:TPR-like protein [Thamnocephalis sphaerospora]|eukprot:RKP07103.1 TPR-like protein [Thamnocephalis sphaerospora]
MARLSNAQLAAQLAEFRQRCDGPPDLVVQYGQELITNGYADQLGDEVWGFYEQLFVAALHTAHWALAQSCLDALHERFPSSTRVRRLDGMLHEAKGNLDVAGQLYRGILEEDETNMLATKRQIAILKGRGRTQEAITALVAFLDTYHADQEAWLELCDLYLSACMYAQALFCVEEVILMQPQNPGLHLKCAEILYTQDQVAMALKSYCRVVELSPTHTRAWYGVKLCATRLLRTSGTGGANRGSAEAASVPKSAMLRDLDALATDRLSAVYASTPAATRTDQPTVRTVVEAWLQAAST